MEYRELVFRASLSEYSHTGERMRSFFRVFIMKYRQEFLDYLLEKTMLGQMRYPLSDMEMLYKTDYLLDKSRPLVQSMRRPGVKRSRKTSGASLAYSLCMAFQSPYALSTLHQKMRTDRFDEGDLKDLKLRLGHPMIKA
jgi:hypothetical protein